VANDRGAARDCALSCVPGGASERMHSEGLAMHWIR